MLQEGLTIVVCSNRLEKIENYVIPSIIALQGNYKTLILLDSKTKHVDFAFLQEVATHKNVEVIASTESGLSNLRNFALRYCTTKYIVFTDDDVTWEAHALRAVENKLQEGIEIVGLPLKTPSEDYLKKWFITENQYHYMGIHARSNINSIWGACMAFNLEFIRKNHFVFPVNLGRQGNIFLNGEDTTFIGDLKKAGAQSYLLREMPMVHHVEKSRLVFKIFARRVYWQGITESVRYNIKKGIIKEFKRNFAVLTPKSFFVGILWFSIFLAGGIDGFVFRKSYRCAHISHEK